MKTWTQIYRHVQGMKTDRPTSLYCSQLWNTVLYCAPDTQKLMRILQETIWRCEADKIQYASDAAFVAECNTKIAGNTELLKWIEEE